MNVAEKKVQGLIADLQRGSIPTPEVIELVSHPAGLVRTNALEALVAHAGSSSNALAAIAAAATDPANALRLMGTISIAHVAVGCLHKVGTAAAKSVAAALLAEWPEPDRADLLWYLQSEGLDF